MKKENYMKNANRWMNEAYETKMDGDMAVETAKEAFSNVVNSPEFLENMKQYLITNELVPEESVVDIVIEEYQKRILPEIESLLRTIE
jgi:hypothetical protein